MVDKNTINDKELSSQILAAIEKAKSSAVACLNKFFGDLVREVLAGAPYGSTEESWEKMRWLSRAFDYVDQELLGRISEDKDKEKVTAELLEEIFSVQKFKEWLKRNPKP